MKNKVLALLTAASVGLCLQGCANPTAVYYLNYSEAAPLKEESFSTIDLNQNPVDQSIFEDYDVTVVAYWATYCPYCIEEMPQLEKWYQELSKDDSMKINLIGAVSKQDKTDDGRVILDDQQVAEIAGDIIKENKVTYTNIVSNEDFTEHLAMDVDVFPTIFFVEGYTGQVIPGSVHRGDDLDVAKDYLNQYLTHGFITPTVDDLEKSHYIYEPGEIFTLENNERIVCVIDSNEELIGILEDELPWYYTNKINASSDPAIASHIKEITRVIPKR